jgi:hypothetical protein
MTKLSHGYKVSKDYKKLFRLIKTQRIVCFVNTDRKGAADWDGYILQDVCQSQAIQSDSKADISSRGFGYITAFQFGDLSVEKDFIEQCMQASLEYIDPDSQGKS